MLFVYFVVLWNAAIYSLCDVIYEAKTGEKNCIASCLGNIGGFCTILSPIAGLFVCLLFVFPTFWRSTLIRSYPRGYLRQVTQVFLGSRYSIVYFSYGRLWLITYTCSLYWFWYMKEFCLECENGTLQRFREGDICLNVWNLS